MRPMLATLFVLGLSLVYNSLDSYTASLYEALTVDHVQPRVRGGDRSGGNLVTACAACNLTKGHRRLADQHRQAVDRAEAGGACRLEQRILLPQDP